LVGLREGKLRARTDIKTTRPPRQSTGGGWELQLAGGGKGARAHCARLRSDEKRPGRGWQVFEFHGKEGALARLLQKKEQDMKYEHVKTRQTKKEEGTTNVDIRKKTKNGGE